MDCIEYVDLERIVILTVLKLLICERSVSPHLSLLCFSLQYVDPTCIFLDSQISISFGGTIVIGAVYFLIVIIYCLFFLQIHQVLLNVIWYINVSIIY